VFKDLVIQIRELNIPDVCNHGRGRFESCSDAQGVKQLIEASMASLEDVMCGLNLDGFLLE